MEYIYNYIYVLLIIVFFMLVLFVPIMIYVANKEAKQDYYDRFSIF